MKKDYTDKAPLEYFLRGKKNGGRLIHPETSDEIEKLLTILAEKGEDYAFAYIRKTIKDRKNCEKRMCMNNRKGDNHG